MGLTSHDKIGTNISPLPTSCMPLARTDLRDIQDARWSLTCKNRKLQSLIMSRQADFEFFFILFPLLEFFFKKLG